MSKSTLTTTRHFLPLTQSRPASADLSWLELLLGVMQPDEKSVRIQK